MTAVMQNVLQREIMVAETVKSYPYPALLPLAQQGLNSYSCTTSCSSALLPQALQQSPYSSQSPNSAIRSMSGHGGVSNSAAIPSMGQNQHGLMNTSMSPPAGLGPSGMMNGDSPNSSAALLKDSIFAQRKQREFIPDNKKDDSYWDRRRRNNEAAKRSREKRRFNDMVLEQRVLELSKENHILRAQVTAFENKFHIKGDGLVNEEQVLSSMPQADQILALTRRPNMSVLGMSGSSSMLSPSSLPSSPPPAPATSLSEEDHYAIPQYAQHQHMEQATHSLPPQANMRSQSPDYFQGESQRSYSPESQNFYESTALNLSARSTRSPPNMEYCDNHVSRSSDYSGLPHKLRHKTNNHHTATLTNHLNNISNQHHHMRPQSTSPLHHEQLPPLTVSHQYQRTPSPPDINTHHHQNVVNLSNGGRPSSPSTSPTSSTHLLYPVKSEPIQRETGEESPNSSDDHDSGISLTSSPTLLVESNYPIRESTEDMDCEGTDNPFRAELHRLASEVRSLKHILNRTVTDPQRSLNNGPRR